jgi:hypothetical protein
MPEGCRTDPTQFPIYRQIARNLGNSVPADQTPETVAAAFVEAGLAADRGRGNATLDAIPTPGATL